MMACPAMVTIGVKDASQRGIGRCTFTNLDGAEIYAEIVCTGGHLVGCAGDRKLPGGTKRFECVGDGGHVTIRGDYRRITEVTDGVTKEEGTGIPIVQALRYKLT